MKEPIKVYIKNFMRFIYEYKFDISVSNFYRKACKFSGVKYITTSYDLFKKRVDILMQERIKELENQ